MGKKKFPLKTEFITTRVTEPVLKEIERIVTTEGYTDVADYMRNLLRKDFKERGITIKMAEPSSKEAEPSKEAT